MIRGRMDRSCKISRRKCDEDVSSRKRTLSRTFSNVSVSEDVLRVESPKKSEKFTVGLSPLLLSAGLGHLTDNMSQIEDLDMLFEDLQSSWIGGSETLEYDSSRDGDRVESKRQKRSKTTTDLGNGRVESAPRQTQGPMPRTQTSSNKSTRRVSEGSSCDVQGCRPILPYFTIEQQQQYSRMILGTKETPKRKQQKEKKRTREKQRRQATNQKFEELARIVKICMECRCEAECTCTKEQGKILSQNEKTNRLGLLTRAVRTIERLRHENIMLKIERKRARLRSAVSIQRA